MTLVSRVLGFLRDMVMAHMLGAGLSADAFFVAFRIPNLLRRFFAEGAFSQAFVPVLSDYKNRYSRAETECFIDRAAGALAGVLGVITVCGVLAAPLIIFVFAPGFLATESKYDLTVSLLRVTFPYIFFISLAAFAAAILQCHGRFAVPAFTPTFLNLSLIVAALWMTGYFEEPVMALAWGVLVGGVAQLLFQLPFVLRLGFFPVPRIRTDDPGVRRMLALMGPSIFGVSVAQINLLIDTLMASFLATGSVSWLYYSDRLVEFPLGVFGIALATVILPQLSDHHSAGSRETFSRTLDWALRCVLAIGAPAAVGLAVLAGPMLCTLFQYGEFGAHDVAMAERSLTAYALGLLAFILIKILAPGYFARHDTKTPVRVGVVAMLLHSGPESGPHRAVGSRRPGALHLARGLCERRAPVPRTAPARGLCPGGGLGGVPDPGVRRHRDHGRVSRHDLPAPRAMARLGDRGQGLAARGPDRRRCPAVWGWALGPGFALEKYDGVEGLHMIRALSFGR